MARVDFALIQPLVLPIEPWLDLRRRLPAVLEDGLTGRPGLEGTVHRAGADAPGLDGGIRGFGSLLDAFPAVLEQVRDLPCLVAPLEQPASRLLGDPARWPGGVEFDRAETLLIVPRSGDLVLLHLSSTSIDVAAFTSTERGLQHEIRTHWVEAIEAERSSLGTRLDALAERLLGHAGPKDPTAMLEGSGGHLVTFAHSADADLAALLQRVHRAQEGSASDERGLLFPDEPAVPCYAHFGWGYTTIATPRTDLSFRLLFPLIGVNQAWYRYRELRGDLIEMARVTHHLHSDRDLIEQTEFYNGAVLDIVVWEAEREAFERALRPVYRAAYHRLWEYWDISESRDTVDRGIDQLRDFLDRKYSVKLATRESTQAKILFVIAMFQLLSVFGLASGYLYFWEKTPLPESAIFNSPIVLWGTIVGPVIVLIVMVLLLVDFFRRHR